ncbi:hypothetical protein ACFLSQ_00955 [Bacteroidota bacterium]
MNKILTFGLCIILLFLVACNDDDTPTNNNNVEKKTSAIINGNDWLADNTFFDVELGVAGRQLRILGIKELDSIELILKIQPSESLEAGTYTIEPDGDYFGIYYHSGLIDTASEGTIYLEKVVEAYPAVAVGTFDFVIKDNQTTLYTITEGVFNSGNAK